MPDASFERTVHFHSAHRYHVPDWSEERNREVFGDLSELHWHGYSATVHVSGPMDPETGFCVDLGELDARLSELRESLDDRVLNDVLPAVVLGRAQPSCEVIAKWWFEELAPMIPGEARLVRVRIAESRDLAAWYPAWR